MGAPSATQHPQTAWGSPYSHEHARPLLQRADLPPNAGRVAQHLLRLFPVASHHVERVPHPDGGHAGAGKTTVAHELAERTGAGGTRPRHDQVVIARRRTGLGGLVTWQLRRHLRARRRPPVHRWGRRHRRHPFLLARDRRSTHRRRKPSTVRSTSSWSVLPPQRFVRSVCRAARAVAARSQGPARTRQMRRRSWTICIDDRSTVRLTRPVLWCEPTNRWTCRASLPPAGSRRSRTRGVALTTAELLCHLTPACGAFARLRGRSANDAGGLKPPNTWSRSPHDGSSTLAVNATTRTTGPTDAATMFDLIDMSPDSTVDA